MRELTITTRLCSGKVYLDDGKLIFESALTNNSGIVRTKFSYPEAILLRDWLIEAFPLAERNGGSETSSDKGESE